VLCLCHVWCGGVLPGDDAQLDVGLLRPLIEETSLTSLLVFPMHPSMVFFPSSNLTIGLGIGDLKKFCVLGMLRVREQTDAPGYK
jgi:hypothetical protein